MKKYSETAGRPAIGLIAALLMVVASALGGCATPPSDPAARAEFEQNNDPLEPTNRYFFELNRFMDFLFIHPWADTYRRMVPEYGRQRIHNMLNNVGLPMDLVNDLLQGRATDGASTLGRFLVNSTLGVGGLFDVATDFGLPATIADFGQTLYVWGLPEGPYLVLPVFGPSNPRDAVGLGVDAYADPVSWVLRLNHLTTVSLGKTGLSAIDRRAEYIEPLEALEKSSIDFYASMRSMSRQHRAKELGIESTTTSGNSSYPSFDFYDDPVAKESPKAK